MKTHEINQIVVVLMVLAVFLYSLTSLTAPNETSIGDALNGKYTSHVERKYDDNFPLKQFAVNTWTAISLVLFSEGQGGVEVGSDGWLFTSEEVRTYPNSPSAYEAALTSIAATQHALEAEGATLIIVPVPSKARVYPEFLNREQDAMQKALYDTFIQDLSDLGTTFVSPLNSLLAAKDDGLVYQQTDTHWSPLGASIVANMVGELAQQNGWMGSDRFSTHETGLERLEGDLTNFLPLSPWFEALSYPPEVVVQSETMMDEQLDLFSIPATPDVYLVGTSYSANALWNFEGSLKTALGRDLINLATEGQGPFVPMAKAIEGQAAFKGAKVVVWEIPERYLINPEFTAIGGDS